MPSSEHPRDVLRRRGLAANRRRGQSFLVSAKIMDRIVEEAQVAPDDVVLEIGTGLGRLTERLASRAHCVVSVEIDKGLCKVAAQRLSGAGNVQLLHADFLAAKHEINPLVTEAVREAAGGQPIKVVSNLPYQISSPAVLNLLEWEVPVREINVMLQADLVARFGGAAGSPEYGPATVVAAYWADLAVLFDVPASAFWPAPSVTSQFVRFVKHGRGPHAKSYPAFVEVVSKLFQQRRKILARALALGWDKAVAQAALSRTGFDGKMRSGTLSVAEFVRLADTLDEMKAGGKA